MVFLCNYKYLTYFLRITLTCTLLLNGIFQDNAMTQKIFPIFSNMNPVKKCIQCQKLSTFARETVTQNRFVYISINTDKLHIKYTHIWDHPSQTTRRAAADFISFIYRFNSKYMSGNTPGERSDSHAYSLCMAHHPVL